VIEGTPAPDFDLASGTGERVSLASLGDDSRSPVDSTSR
jgi:peroxiredoxin